MFILFHKCPFLNVKILHLFVTVIPKYFILFKFFEIGSLLLCRNKPGSRVDVMNLLVESRSLYKSLCPMFYFYIPGVCSLFCFPCLITLPRAPMWSLLPSPAWRSVTLSYWDSPFSLESWVQARQVSSPGICRRIFPVAHCFRRLGCAEPPCISAETPTWSQFTSLLAHCWIWFSGACIQKTHW